MGNNKPLWAILVYINKKPICARRTTTTKTEQQQEKEPKKKKKKKNKRSVARSCGLPPMKSALLLSFSPCHPGGCTPPLSLSFSYITGYRFSRVTRGSGCVNIWAFLWSLDSREKLFIAHLLLSVYSENTIHPINGQSRCKLLMIPKKMILILKQKKKVTFLFARANKG